MSARNYYQILGVSSSASDEEIRKAYHRLIKRFHPDHSPACKEAAKITSLLNEAYKVCSNSESRRAYDHTLGICSEELRVKKVAILSSGFCMNNIWKKFKRKKQ